MKHGLLVFLAIEQKWEYATSSGTCVIKQDSRYCYILLKNTPKSVREHSSPVKQG